MGSEIQPEIIIIWNEAKAYIEQGNYDKAIEIYKYVLVRYGDNAVAVEHANAYLGDIYLTLKRSDLAESYINKAIGYNPEKAGYHYMLGFVYSIQKQWEKAVREFQTAVNKKSNDAEHIRGLGWAVFNGGDRLKGMEYLQQACDLAPTNVNILLDLANVYLENLNFEKAQQYAKRALGLEPGNSLAQQVFEKVCQFQRDYEKTRGRGSAPDGTGTGG